MSTDNSKLSISLSLTNPPRRVTIDLPSPAPSSSLHELASDATGIPQSSIRLIYRGKIIPSNPGGNNVIDDFKLEDGCVVHCIGKPVAAATAAPLPSLNATPSSAGSPGSIVTPPPSVPPSTNNNTANNNSSSSNNQNPLNQALQAMKNNHSPSEYLTALNTISKILSNIINNPMEEKYRKVKRSNAAFTKRLGRLVNSHEVMMSIGFNSDQEEYNMIPSAEAWPKLTQSKKVIDDEINLNNTATGVGNISSATVGGAGRSDLGFGAIPTIPTPATGAFPNMNNLNIPPQALQMMEATLSNPSALQSMLSNPMIQQMIMNDPRLNNNPMMQHSMRELMNNPGMIQQMSQMMNDPNVRSRLNGMMQMQQQVGGIGNSGNNNSGSGSAPDLAAQMEMMRQFANMASSNVNNNNVGVGNQQQSQHQQQQQPSSNVTSNQHQQNQSNSNAGAGTGGNDNEMTEEEMIAEAIARSLREQ